MEKDLLQKKYLSDDERYADLINGLLFNGKQQVKASDLQETDSQSFIRLWFQKKSVRYRKLYRDLIKKTAFGVNFALIGIENQELVHYLMPLRTMEYDAAEYEKQVVRIRRRVKNAKGIRKAEFISGFSKSDRLYPCITIVLYYGENWDGPKSLHDVIDFTDIPGELRKYVNDYPLHIIEVHKLEDTSAFRSDIKQVFDFIKSSKNKIELKELISNDPAYQHMDEDTFDMIAACTNAEELISVKKYHGKDGKIDMCQALKEMLADERMIGMKEGIKEGIEAFVLDNLEEGVEQKRIVDKLIFRFKMDEVEAKDYVNKYIGK